MRILGLDIGSHHAGAAVLECDGTGAPTLVALAEWGMKDPQLDIRLCAFWTWAKSLIQKYELMPSDVLAVEMPFVGIPRTALILGQILGIVRTVAWWAGLKLILVSAKEGKKALSGRGSAYKGEMVAAAKIQFGVDATEDQADALGIALSAADRLKEREIVAHG